MPKGDNPQQTDSGTTQPPTLISTLADTSQGPNLVYGLEKSRQVVRDQSGIVNFDDNQPHPFSMRFLDRHTGERMEAETRGPTTADVMNNQAFRTFRTQLQGQDDTTRSYSLFNPDARVQFPTPMIRLEALREHLRESTKTHSVSDQTTFRHYQDGLLSSKHSPLLTVAGDVQTMAKKENMPDPQRDGQKQGEVMFRHQTAIACKFGLDYGQSNGRILFELGSQKPGAPNYFDPHSAPEKRSDDGRGSQSTGTNLRSITNVELRKAFRHDMGDDRLIFHAEGVRTQAPWDGNQDWRWSKYAYDRVEKHVEKGHLSEERGELLKQKLLDAAGNGSLDRQTFREVNAEINQAKPQSSVQMPKSPYPHLDVAYSAIGKLEAGQGAPLPGVENVQQRALLASSLAVQLQEHKIDGVGGVMYNAQRQSLLVWDQSSNPDVSKRFELPVAEALKASMADNLKTLEPKNQTPTPELEAVTMRAKL